MVAFAQTGTDSQSIAHIRNTARLPVEQDELGARLRELMTLGALAADRFPAPDPAAFLRRLGIAN